MRRNNFKYEHFINRVFLGRKCFQKVKISDLNHGPTRTKKKPCKKPEGNLFLFLCGIIIIYPSTHNYKNIPSKCSFYVKVIWVAENICINNKKNKNSRKAERKKIDEKDKKKFLCIVEQLISIKITFFVCVFTRPLVHCPMVHVSNLDENDDVKLISRNHTVWKRLFGEKLSCFFLSYLMKVEFNHAYK